MGRSVRITKKISENLISVNLFLRLSDPDPTDLPKEGLDDEEDEE